MRESGSSMDLKEEEEEDVELIWSWGWVLIRGGHERGSCSIQKGRSDLGSILFGVLYVEKSEE